MRHWIRYWCVAAACAAASACEGTPVAPDDSASRVVPAVPVATPPNPNPGVPRGQQAPAPFIWSGSEEMEEIPLPMGSRWGVASAINSRGDVVGWYQPGGENIRAFIWSRERGFRSLPQVMQRAENVWATDINDLGQVTGLVSFAWDAGVSFVWSETGGMTIVAMPGADVMANAINDKGEVVGQMVYQYGNPNAPSVAHEAFVWDRTTGFRRAAGPGQYRYATAADINEAGEIVGLDASEFRKSPRPVMWSMGLSSPVALAPRVGYEVCDNWWPVEGDTGTCGEATGINSRGDAVGSANGRAFRTPRDGDPTYMSATEGRASFATAINDAGDVAGYSVSHPGFGSIIGAFVWREDGTVVRLASLPGTTATYANDINEKGQVVGFAR